MAEKKCIKCGLIKAPEAFSLKKTGVFYSACKKCRNAVLVAQRRANPALARKYFQNFKKNNPEAYRARYARANRKRYSTPEGRLRVLISARVTRTLNGQRKHLPTFQAIGYTLAELRDHLEKQFLPGMSWDNYGDWHVDHIVPLKNFPYISLDDPNFRAAWALTNLRPLWATDNCRKGGARVFLV